MFDRRHFLLPRLTSHTGTRRYGNEPLIRRTIFPERTTTNRGSPPLFRRSGNEMNPRTGNRFRMVSTALRTGRIAFRFYHVVLIFTFYYLFFFTKTHFYLNFSATPVIGYSEELCCCTHWLCCCTHWLCCRTR